MELYLGLGALQIALLILALYKLRGGADARNKETAQALEKLSRDLAAGSLEVQKTITYSLLEAGKKQFEQFGIIAQSMSATLMKNAEDTNRQIRVLGEGISAALNAVQEKNEKSLEKINLTLDQKIARLQEGNEKKLDQMRGLVEEKLQKTLDARLTESFKSVNEHLNNVQRGLGEMKSLASDVGGLKKALTNVKQRGIFGEVQLERILEQVFPPSQYDKNIATKPGSGNRVEFALKLPGRQGEGTVYLPMDSKFPAENYEKILEGYESGDKEKIEAAKKALAANITMFAGDIAEKYLDPPHTTDFGILFLPTEGLYAEVVQNPALFETLQSKYKITVTGPSTLVAFLNALLMGFKTLAIEKRSLEVWNVLGAVKTEFGKFALALESAQKKIRSADSELEQLVGARTNVMQRKLRAIHDLPEEEAQKVLEQDL